MAHLEAEGGVVLPARHTLAFIQIQKVAIFQKAVAVQTFTAFSSNSATNVAVVVQITSVLYHVLGLIDGRRDCDAIASSASQLTDITLAGPDIEFLVRERLEGLGLASFSGQGPEVRAAGHLLVLRGRRRLVSAE